MGFQITPFQGELSRQKLHTKLDKTGAGTLVRYFRDEVKKRIGVVKLPQNYPEALKAADNYHPTHNNRLNRNERDLLVIFLINCRPENI